MVDQVSQTALETIRDLLIEEVRFLSNVSGEVEKVQMELKTIHSFLKDADTRPDRYDSNTVRAWVADLKELAFQAEDVLEKYTIQVASKREGRNLKAKLRRFACILSKCISVHEVGKDIEMIRSQMTQLTTRSESMTSKGEGSSNSANNEYLQLRQTYAHQVEEHFVGMDKDIECLVSLVSDVRTNRVISIYGMGGLGKTTLARKIYQNKEVQRSFEARAWVCVSQQFNAKSVLQQVLKQLVPDERKGQLANMEQNELVIELDNVMRGKRCFVVIDDIWEINHWEIIKPAFPIVDVDSKILLTTRNEKIASKGYPYRLDCLTEDQGWELLQKIALLKDHSQGLKNDELRQRETIGREMVRKCGRLPLAISVIGGSLRHKQTLSEWEKVNENIDVYLKQQEEGVGENKRVAQVLDLSYNTLPYYLKPCFLYLGCFPEDQEIDAEKLYLLWMAEGMISSEEKGNRETLRDVAERYLSELAFRCMAKEEKFLKVIDFEEATDHVTSPIGDIPRLVIYLNEGRHFRDINFNEGEKLEHMRSLLILQKVKNRWLSTMSDRESNFNKFKFLRILILESCKFEDGRSLLREVGKLVHLRYLSLYGFIFPSLNAVELPRSICNLPYLHTLNLNGNSLRLPNKICKMKRLRHLFLGKNYRIINGEKLRLDGLNELETLEGFRSDVARAADIPKLTNLQKLNARIYDNESLSVIANHISNNKSQQLRETTLRIYMWNISSLVEEGPSVLRKLFISHSLVHLKFRGRIGCNLPCYEPAGFCKNLLGLSLDGSEIEEDHVMETLGKFPMLNSLGLNGADAFIGTEMIFHANAFQQLKTLIIDGLSNLEIWRVDEGAMPNLSEFIRN
ncbi:hypothetical protein BUALT_Bualt02G0029700 [Buddleja alternifolia]|uniref:Disease resistance protein n=1 Tax=Buddleja alternifolia TaxID=168488 RepID=A0AAV6XX41_9LAMI|nr:hypothetical protein BUALT_Bualt02G0029700 [Buddleja alternifolia]